MSVAITLTDEEVAESNAGTAMIFEMITDARHTIEHSHARTAEEIALEYERFVDIFELIVTAGAMLVDSSIEISRMTEAPTE